MLTIKGIWHSQGGYRVKKVRRPQVQAGKLTFGGGAFLLGVPLASSNCRQLETDAKRALLFHPDLFEWRADSFESYPEPDPLIEALVHLKSLIGGKPLLFTARHAAEDGKVAITDSQKFALLEAMSKTRQIELFDIELRYGKACLLDWRKQLHARGAKLIISHHSFGAHMDKAAVLHSLRHARDCGADIVKLINKVDSYEELANYSEAIQEARETFLNVPLIAGGVGKASAFLRIMGDSLGSDMAFVSTGGRKSHPSQLHIQDVRRLRGLMGQRERSAGLARSAR